MNLPNIKSFLDSTPHMLTLFSCGVLLFSSLLCLEFRKSSHAGANEIIGYVAYKHKAVKRKADSTVVWEDVEQKLPIARRDTIQTSALSDTVITLNDGTELKIAENSMVLLDFTENKMNLDFKYGSIETNRNGKGNDSLVIESGGVKVNVGNGDLQLNKRENSDLSVINTRGEASIQKGDNSVSLKENSQAILKNKEAPEIREMEIRLLSPEPSRIFYVKEKSKEVSFFWNSKSNKSKIQISQDVTFSKLVAEQTLDTPQYKKKLEVGSYFWRVVDLNSKIGNEIEVRKFFVLEEIPFRYSYPLNGSDFAIHKKPVFVNFAWDKVEGIQSYSLEISKAQNFSSIEKKQDVLGNSYGVEFTEEGKYFFRIKTRSNNPDLPEKQTDTGMFILKKQESISPPMLVNPKNGISIEEGAQTLLGWKTDPSYDTFTLLIAENQEFTLNTRTVKTKENYALLDKLKAGKTYFWKVEGNGSDSKALATSSVYSFTIQEKTPAKTVSLNPTESRELEGEEEKVEIEEPPYVAPTLQEPENNLVQEVSDATSIHFSWKKQPRDIGYRFYLYRLKDFSEELVLKKEIQKSSLDVDNQYLAQSGKYYWLVEGKYKKGDKLLYEKSKKREFKLIPKLLPPKIKKSEEVYYINEK
ncbi:MAG: FecR domain-containing protein [Leptospiraceae bacterium]|nr:FecR domain-containing protein [Leptospiraceae bacterium]